MWRLLLILLGYSCLISSCSLHKKQSSYRIGIDPSWYPLESGGQEKHLLAFATDMLIEIAKKEHLSLSTMTMSWDNLFLGLKDGRYDGILSSLPPYSFYQNDYQFSEPLIKTGPVLIVDKNSKINRIDQLGGKEVAILHNSSALPQLEKVEGILLRIFDSVPMALDALLNQEVDAAALNILFAQNYVRDLYADQLKVVTTPLTDEGVRLITLRNQAPELIDRFNDGIRTLKKSGQYPKLLEKWGLSHTSAPSKDLNQKIQDFLLSKPELPTLSRKKKEHTYES